jgi:hypothetical protein
MSKTANSLGCPSCLRAIGSWYCPSGLHTIYDQPCRSLGEKTTNNHEERLSDHVLLGRVTRRFESPWPGNVATRMVGCTVRAGSTPTWPFSPWWQSVPMQRHRTRSRVELRALLHPQVRSLRWMRDDPWSIWDPLLLVPLSWEQRLIFRERNRFLITKAMGTLGLDRRFFVISHIFK